MVEKWLRSPSIIIFLSLIVFCCAFGFIQSVLLLPEQAASGEISAVLLKPSDSPLFQGATFFPSDQCDLFLVPANALRNGLLRCHQVQLTRTDIRRQYLNGAWEYDSPDRAAEAVRIASSLPQLYGAELSVIDAPQVGTFSVATMAIVVAPRGDTYIQNIFWSRGNVFFRLSVISQEPTIFNDLYSLAILVDGRAN